MKAMLGMKVCAHNGTCSVGGMFRYETFLYGEVVKVNAKSIRVAFTTEIRTCNGNETERKSIERTESFKFWKVIGGAEVYTAQIDCYRYLVRI